MVTSKSAGVIAMTALLFPVEPVLAYEYPELAVTPRATERIALEARSEPEHRWSSHLSIQVSAAATLGAGVAALAETLPDPSQNREQNWLGGIGVAVGAGWLLTTTLMSSMYTPYSTATMSLNKLPAASRREQLVKERLAEEAIESAASTGRRMAWMSAGTNLAASALIIAASNGGPATWIGASGMVLSFAPLVFKSRWQEIANRHREYKKRIYGPVASPALLPDPETRRLSPALTLSFSF